MKNGLSEQDAEQNGFKIKYVFLTHFHADFVAGHIELRDKVGTKIYLGEAAQPEYEFTALKEGDVLEFGKVRLSVLETCRNNLKTAIHRL